MEINKYSNQFFNVWTLLSRVYVPLEIFLLLYVESFNDPANLGTEFLETFLPAKITIVSMQIHLSQNMKLDKIHFALRQEKNLLLGIFLCC